MFKRYLNDLIDNKVSLIVTLLSIPLIIYNCLSIGWIESKFLKESNNQLQLEEVIPQAPEFLPKQEVIPENEEEKKSDLDKAYDFVKENVVFESNDEISLEIQKEDNSIVFVYKFNETLDDVIQRQGLSKDFLFSMAEDMAECNLLAKNSIKEQLGIEVNIKAKLYDSKNNLYAYGYGTKRYFKKFKLLDSKNIPKLDLIPVRVGNVGYMYDKVSGKLFGNVGTGSFILGPDK
jgi:hypothetical protein